MFGAEGMSAIRRMPGIQVRSVVRPRDDRPAFVVIASGAAIRPPRRPPDRALMVFGNPLRPTAPQLVTPQPVPPERPAVGSLRRLRTSAELAGEIHCWEEGTKPDPQSVRRHRMTLGVTGGFRCVGGGSSIT